MTEGQHDRIRQAARDYLQSHQRSEEIGRDLHRAQQDERQAYLIFRAALRQDNITKENAVQVDRQIWWIAHPNCDAERIESVMLASQEAEPTTSNQ